MTLEQARENIGAQVVYTSRHGARDWGQISSVGQTYIFVKYQGSAQAQATPPELLSLP